MDIQATLELARKLAGLEFQLILKTNAKKRRPIAGAHLFNLELYSAVCSHPAFPLVFFPQTLSIVTSVLCESSPTVPESKTHSTAR